MVHLLTKPNQRNPTTSISTLDTRLLEKRKDKYTSLKKVLRIVLEDIIRISDTLQAFLENWEVLRIYSSVDYEDIVFFQGTRYLGRL